MAIVMVKHDEMLHIDSEGRPLVIYVGGEKQQTNSDPNSDPNSEPNSEKT